MGLLECGSLRINISACTSACRGKTGYVWISLDPTKAKPTLRGDGGGVVAKPNTNMTQFILGPIFSGSKIDMNVVIDPN